MKRSKHKFSKSQMEVMPQIHEIELLRETSKSQLDQPSYPINNQRAHYINQKLSVFTSMVMNQKIRQNDLVNTLQKFKIGSPRNSYLTSAV